MSTREQTPTPAAAVEDAPATATIWNKVGYWLPHLVALAYCLVILMAISTQFTGAHDMPCPLCTLQRMAMILIGIGAVWMVGLTRKGRMNMGAYARGYGLMILGALLGMIISTRQVLLHIEPDDPGYGGTVLGLHFYTWALITFLIVLVYCGVMLALTRRTYSSRSDRQGRTDAELCHRVLLRVRDRAECRTHLHRTGIQLGAAG